MAGPRRKLAIAQGPQFPAHRLGRKDDMESFKHLLAEVDKPPAHDAVRGRDRPILHHASQGCAMLRRQPRRLTRRLAGDQPGRTVGVELHHPVPDDLKRHAADLRRLRARRPVVNRSHSQEPARLAAVLRPSCLAAKLGGVKILSKRDRHCETPSFQHRIKSEPIRESPASHNQRELVLEFEGTCNKSLDGLDTLCLVAMVQIFRVNLVAIGELYETGDDIRPRWWIGPVVLVEDAFVSSSRAA